MEIKFRKKDSVCKNNCMLFYEEKIKEMFVNTESNVREKLTKKEGKKESK